MEKEKKKLLSELSLLQTQRNLEEANHPSIGDRVSSKVPTTPDEKIDLFFIKKRD